MDLGENEKLLKNIRNRYGKKYKLSVGIDILHKKVDLGEGVEGQLLIWNLSGENIFQLIKELYHKEDNIAFIVFNLVKVVAYNQMNKYLSMIRQLNIEEYPYILIGNKSTFLKKDDLYVYSNAIKKFAESQGCIYLEVAAKQTNEVYKAFNQLTKRILSSEIPI
ncbi:MAG: hypothetical protein ACFFAA_11515 [Promethearchaeota archaeon]